MEYNPERLAEWDLYCLAGQDMPVGCEEVEEAMEAYKKELLQILKFPEMIERHRPLIRRDMWSYRPGFYNVQCTACDGNVWRTAKLPDDDIPECEFWANAKALDLVTDSPLPCENSQDEGDTTNWLEQ